MSSRTARRYIKTMKHVPHLSNAHHLLHCRLILISELSGLDNKAAAHFHAAGRLHSEF
jgi:hypothetical protein